MLLGEGTGPNYALKAEQAWKSVKKECVELGFDRFSDRTVQQLRDNLFAHKKTGFLKKYDGMMRTGSGRDAEWKPVFFIIFIFLLYP